MHKLKINNSLDVALWEKITCKCNHSSVETEYPISECLHCKCQEAWESVPQEDFTVMQPDLDENNNALETTHSKTVNEITLIRGKYEDVIGWRF